LGVEKGEQALADEIEDAVMSLTASKRADDDAVELVVKRASRIYFDRVWGKRPVISTIVHRVTR
ncbi:MAG: MBL fold metallo-hydrolase, partial [Hyphococcus sp.]